MRDRITWLTTPLLLAALVLAWDVYVRAADVSTLILPPPADVWAAIIELARDPRTLPHVTITIYETLVGFFIAIAVGVGLGAILGKVAWLERTLNPIIVGLQVMPKIALVPLFIIWFGFGPTSKIVIAAVLAFFPIMTNTMLGMKSVDRGHRDVMTSLNAGRWQTFRDMELPHALPFILTGMEVGIVLAIIGAIVGEYLGGSTGLGHLAVARLNAFDTPGMFAVIFALTAIGFVLYFAVVRLRRFVTPWHEAVSGTQGSE
jgi:NitT/TauT family transport system permease protein